MNQKSKFKEVINIMAFFLFSGFTVAQENIPNNIKSDGVPYIKYSYEVVLTSGMSKTLREYSLKSYPSEFRIFNINDYAEDMRNFSPANGDFSDKACYSAIFGDFNGDKLIDAVVFGESNHWVEGLPGDGKRELFPVVALLSEGTTGYQAAVVANGTPIRPVKMFLRVVRPQEIKGNQTGKKIEPKYDAIGLSWEGADAHVYYWDVNTKKFEGFGTLKNGILIKDW